MQNAITPGILLADISDHLPIFLVLKNLGPEAPSFPRMVRDYSNFKQSDFLKELEQSLESLKRIRTDNCNTIFQNFLTILHQVIDRHVPLRECTKKDTRRHKNPWITGGIIKSISTKFKLYSKKLKNNTPENDRKYKKYRNYLNRAIENRKLDYYKKKLAEVQNQSRDVWRTLNEIIGQRRSKKSQIKQICDENGNILTSRKDIANTFNNQFGKRR